MRTLILVLVLTSGALAQSQPASSLDAARELYASADYRGALEMLDRLAAADSTRPDRPSIDLYRAFCLIALERAGEADEAIVAMITAIHCIGPPMRRCRHACGRCSSVARAARYSDAIRAREDWKE